MRHREGSERTPIREEQTEASRIEQMLDPLMHNLLLCRVNLLLREGHRDFWEWAYSLLCTESIDCR